MEIFEGRPRDESSRLEKEIKCYDFLDTLGIQYSRVDHEPANDMEACLKIEEAIGVGICKNLFLCSANKKNFYLLMMQGQKSFKTAIISKQLGISRLSFAPAEFMEELLNITPGSVSVLGLMNDKEHKIKLLIDKDILKQDFVRCHPCINTSTLKIKTNDFLEKILPRLNYEPILVEI